MSGILPVNVEDLLTGRPIESVRVEFKASWDPDTTGFQVLKTVCAFANDFQNLNGGYIVVGVDASGSQTVRGLTDGEIDDAQRWIRGRCKAMQPGYVPALSPERIGERDVLVVWAPASEDRPHRAPDGPGSKSWKYWIRTGSETVDAEACNQLDRLLEQATPIPWDNRAARDAKLDDLRETKVREHLHDVKSALRDEPDAPTIYRRMRITVPANQHEAPRNVGLLFFSDDPERWFPGSRIVVAQFAADRAGEVQNERAFHGALAAQLRDCLRHLEGFAQTHLKLKLLGQLAASASARDAIDTAILARRLREPRIAHRCFEQAGDSLQADSRALHEFAQTKMRLAQEARAQRGRAWWEVNRRLLVEARGLLVRVTQMEASPTRHAWTWRDLARTLNWLRAPASEVTAAYENAIKLLPGEARFPVELAHFRERRPGTAPPPNAGR